MKNYPNIETRKFPGHDYYTGYAGGKVWRISKIGKNAWKAVTSDFVTGIYERTMGDISARLTQFDNYDK